MDDWLEVSAPNGGPFPVRAPTELEDDDYETWKGYGSPYKDQVLARLNQIRTSSVLVSILILGIDGQSSGIRQGFYFRGLRTNRNRLWSRFAAMSSFNSSETQLTLSIGLIPATDRETREIVVGWGFREI